MRAFVYNVGLLARGLPNWVVLSEIVRGERVYADEDVRAPMVCGLASNEARRCPLSARIAIDGGQQALAGISWAAASLATVFSSASGDLDILDKNCRALAQPHPALSPTLFHNSVHNAVAGYWGIATGSRAASTSLSAYDDSFAAGLIEAVSQTASLSQRVLLVVYDIETPKALAAARHITSSASVALALASEKTTGAWAEITIRWCANVSEASYMADRDLENLRCANPALRALPLLAALATKEAVTLSIPYLDAALTVKVTPCK